MPTRTPPKKRNGFVATVLGAVKKREPREPARKALPPYPRAVLKAVEARAGYVAIYVIAPREQAWPITFGITSDPAVAYAQYQRGYWEEQAIHELQWTPGRPAAERVKRAMVDMLGSHRRFFARNWYDTPVDAARLALITCAKAHGVELFDDLEKSRRLHRIAQKAWEAKLGVETLQTQAPDIMPSAAQKAIPASAIILPMKPRR